MQKTSKKSTPKKSPFLTSGQQDSLVKIFLSADVAGELKESEVVSLGNSSMKLLYGYILDTGEQEFTVSYRKLGKAVGMKRNTVGRNMRKLHNAGILRIQSRFSEDGARVSNKFILY